MNSNHALKSVSGIKSRVYRQWRGNVAIPSIMHTKPTKSIYGLTAEHGQREKKKAKH